MTDLFSCGKTSETHTISHYHVQISNLIDSQRLVLPLALCCTSHGSFTIAGTHLVSISARSTPELEQRVEHTTCYKQEAQRHKIQFTPLFTIGKLGTLGHSPRSRHVHVGASSSHELGLRANRS